MSVLIAHLSLNDAKAIRQAVAGCGFTCDADDCVPWSELANRLAHNEPDLIVVQVDDDPSLRWDVLRDALSHTSTPRVLVGPITDLTRSTRQELGILGHFTTDQMHREIESLAKRLMRAGLLDHHQGKLISVLPFSGLIDSNVVAEHLAGALNVNHPDRVALLEMATSDGSLSALLDLEPRFTFEHAADMWSRLDLDSFRTLLAKHDSGISVLPAEEESLRKEVERDALNRILLLSRLTFPFTVLSLENYRSECELEAIRSSNHVVMVVLPEVPSLRRAKRFLNAMNESNISVEHLIPVIPRWGQGGQVKKQYLEEYLEMKLTHFVPDDPKRINRSINHGTLIQTFAPRCRACRTFQQLAHEVNGSQ